MLSDIGIVFGEKLYIRSCLHLSRHNLDIRQDLNYNHQTSIMSCDQLASTKSIQVEYQGRQSHLIELQIFVKKRQNADVLKDQTFAGKRSDGLRRFSSSQ